MHDPLDWPNLSIMKMIKTVPIILPFHIDLMGFYDHPLVNKVFLDKLIEHRGHLEDIMTTTKIESIPPVEILGYFREFLDRWSMFHKFLSNTRHDFVMKNPIAYAWQSSISEVLYEFYDQNSELYLWSLTNAHFNINYAIVTQEIESKARIDSLEYASRCINGICCQELANQGEYFNSFRYTGMIENPDAIKMAEISPSYCLLLDEVIFSHLQMITLDDIWQNRIKKEESTTDEYILKVSPTDEHILGLALWLIENLKHLESLSITMDIEKHALVSFINEYKIKCMLWIGYFHSHSMDKSSIKKINGFIKKTCVPKDASWLSSWRKKNNIPINHLSKPISSILNFIDEEISSFEVGEYNTKDEESVFNISITQDETSSNRFIKNWEAEVKDVKRIFYKQTNLRKDLEQYRTVKDETILAEEIIKKV